MEPSRIVGGNSEYGRIASDYYPTPPEVTRALLLHLDMPKDTVIWEPACGDGYMAEEMKRCGYTVVSTDIRETGYGGVADFLNPWTRFPGEWIITNPPFSLSAQFIQRCHQHGKPFALLLKSQYWHAKSRLELFEDIRPHYILPLTWRPDFTFKTRGKGSPLMDVVWCVWDEDACETKYIPLRKPRTEAPQ